MDNTYIEKQYRKKILFLSDDFRLPSGIGTMSREIVLGTCHKYNWVQLGCAIDHGEKGKIIDMNKSVEESTGVKDPSVFIYPYNTYGDSHILRILLEREKPDAILHFTDPRFWQFLYNMEHEIRYSYKIPIMYLNIWDDLPFCRYNSNAYMSCDLLMGISKQTVNINKVILGEGNYEII